MMFGTCSGFFPHVSACVFSMFEVAHLWGRTCSDVIDLYRYVTILGVVVRILRSLEIKLGNWWEFMSIDFSNIEYLLTQSGCTNHPNFVCLYPCVEVLVCVCGNSWFGLLQKRIHEGHVAHETLCVHQGNCTIELILEQIIYIVTNAFLSSELGTSRLLFNHSSDAQNIGARLFLLAGRAREPFLSASDSRSPLSPMSSHFVSL